jgi:beta-galactosidase GanA
MIVDGKPFLMLAAELHNSSASSLDYLKPIWPRLVAMHINTVLTPIYWELMEPEEGKFDFSLVDGQIREAGANHLRLVFLWFGSWKNGMSSYIPVWVKANPDRFARVQDKEGKGIEILSTFSTANRDADARAYAALMRHIKEVDTQHTVIMMQVENEVGVLGDSRDRSEAANKAFAEQVPKELMDHLQQRGDELFPDLHKLWQAAGGKTVGTWEQIFGKGPATDEIFMAWNYARYIDHVTAAGKAEDPLPMFANVWLSGGDRKPGDWPSGCPEPHVMDIWQAGAPQIDAYAPDIYSANFAEMAEKYHRSGNPLFIAETSAQTGEVNVFYAFGQHGATCFSPFAIDSLGMPRGGGEMTPPEKLPLTRSYEIISQLAPLILENMGKGTMAGVVLDGDSPQTIAMGNYKLELSRPRFRRPAPPPAAAPAAATAAPPAAPLPPGAPQLPERSSALIISIGPDEYLITGSGGVNVTFSPNSPGPPIAGIAYVEEGTFTNGRWVAGRRLNGDENGQGKNVRIGAMGNNGSIQRVKLYRYR